MARKIIDIIPVISVRPTAGDPTPDMDAARKAASEFIDSLKGGLADPTDFDFSATYETDARCEHCNCSWTEESPDYNGGCCDLDASNDPKRLERLGALAGDLIAADLYRDDDRRGHAGHNEFADLGDAVAKWLAAGRPSESAADLRRLADLVFDHKWGALLTDPGVYPSNAGAGPLPDRWMVDTHPNELADQVIDLLDDMGLRPARKAA